MIPFADLKAQYSLIKEELEPAVRRVMESGQYALGPEVEKFEKEFAEFNQTRFAVGVNSGTSALHLALLAAGVGAGDEVLTVPFTFVATVAAILYAGARPVFVDVHPDSLTMDIDAVERAVTPRTRAIIPVHLYGQAADMDPLVKISQKYGIALIEDASQAHGCEYKGRKVGGIGSMGTFSFYPAKNLGASGEGGMVLTQDADLAGKIRLLRSWGEEPKNYHRLKGFNYRMEALQAAVLSVKLRHLEHWNKQRGANAAEYDKRFEGTPVVTPQRMPYSNHVFYIYAIRIKRRNELLRYLYERKIFAGVHYPVPVHLQEAYRDLGYHRGDFPAAEKAADEVLSLPVYPELSAGQIDRVCATVKEGLRKAG